MRYELLEMHQGATIDGELRPLKAEDKPALIKLAAARIDPSAAQESSMNAVAENLAVSPTRRPRR